ncbi:glycan-binding surface protein [Dysgonomonas sp. UBA7698]|uniref:glycan-binding surface protein n=1 Tax=Dysgonomonas sp. UBA7698 TaxID=1946427 RepID=UPI0025B7E102|nr:glycan-binding surface protein [Dysgonomonas sp. UBA7698]
MKNLYIIFALFVIALFWACSDDDSDSKGAPVVDYVRSCDPAEAEIHLTSALLGNKIAIVGNNLGSVNKVYFNDVQAKLTPVFVTDNSIIVEVPTDLPTDKQDLITLYSSNGTSCNYSFVTVVPGPTIKSMDCEFVADGDIAYINGTYLTNYETDPLKVIFTGDAEGEVVECTLERVAVKVPAGAQPGPVTVTSAYGTATSVFNFRDNRTEYVIMDFDNIRRPIAPLTDRWSNGWHRGENDQNGGERIGTNGITGQYLILKGNVNVDGDAVNVSEWDFCFDAWPFTSTAPDLLDAKNINNLALKFEAKVVGEWTGGALQTIFTSVANASYSWVDPDANHPNELWKWDAWGADPYPRTMWAPWADNGGSYSTDGKWITVTIPMSECKYGMFGKVVGPKPAGNYAGMTLFVNRYHSGSGKSCYLQLYIDNIRVVPNK